MATARIVALLSRLFRAAALGITLTIPAQISLAASTDGTRLNVANLPKIAEVDPRFQSYNIEMAEVVGGRFWAPYPRPGISAVPENTQASGGLALEARLFRQRPPADLANARLRYLAQALGPTFIRISGSWANTVFFQDDEGPRLTKPPAGFQNVLTRAQWAGVVDFARKVNGLIVTSFAVSEGTRDQGGAWKPDDARKLLRYTHRIGGRVYAAELINEPNLGATSGLPSGYNPEAFARDIAAFNTFVKREAPDLKTVGPGSTGETGVSLFANRGMSTEAMLSAEPRAHFDIFSYHFYGGRSERCSKMAPASAILPENALGEEWLSRTDSALAYYKRLRDRFAPGAPIWLNETAQASCGGDRWASSFLDSFRYADQMGRLAKQGVVAIFHNTLAASDYGLIDETTLTPRPNYWTALLWRRLMGTGVLDAGDLKPGLHLYAHCLRGHPGGVALVALNLDRTKAYSLTLPIPAERYSLTADDLLADTVNLNGRPLALIGDRLPLLKHVTAHAGTNSLAPASITFLAMPSAKNVACR